MGRLRSKVCSGVLPSNIGHPSPHQSAFPGRTSRCAG